MTTTHHPPEATDAEATDAEAAEVADAEAAVGATAEGATGEAADVGAADAEAETAVGVEAAAPAAPGRLRRLLRRAARWPRRRVAAVAVLLAAVLASGGLLYAAAQLRDPAATGNRALTDTAPTDQVTGDVSNALTRVFAYTPDDTQSTAQAARDVLAGHAATQYQSLFAQIREQVASQRLTLTTRVVRAGVVSLTGHRARLLVFLDQTAQRAGGAATSAAAQLSVTAQYSGGHWRITELTAR
jgi:Mce-associated membrane protein